MTHRPFPEKCREVPYFEKGKYDLAILHVDQQSIYDLEAGDRITKGLLYQEVREIIGNDCPIVTINHMTPFHDKYESDYVVERIKEMTAGTTVVVNSYESARQWGFGRPIIHGMNLDEWWDLPKEARAVTVLSQGGMEKAYRRIFLIAVKKILAERGVPFVWVGVDTHFKSFDAYRDYLGRSLVFFMPTWQSPRPRARTEAMLSGCCVVSTPYQDAATYIEDGVNGFLTSSGEITDPRIMDNPEKVADLITELVLEKPDEAVRIGRKGKETAQKLFNLANFEKQWVDMLKEINVL